MKKYAYLTLFTKNKKGKYEFLIGFKKFMNKDDGYIGTNPYQYVIPGGNIMEMESDTNCAIREFHEETGYNLYDLGCEKTVKVFENKFASFFISYIPYENKKSFVYSRNKIINLGHYPEFDTFEWTTIPEAINKFNKKIDINIMMSIYFDNLENFIHKKKPIWINKSEYTDLKNMNISSKTKKSLKKYIGKRLDNGWFIDMFEAIQEKY